MAKAIPSDPLPRWRATGVLLAEPEQPLVLPVRGWRVLFGLPAKQFDGFVKHQMPHAHEFYAPIEALTAENGDQDVDLRALISLASPSRNVLERKQVG